MSFVTAGPGSGGHLAAAPEDFIVEEVLAYQPSGAGEHLYVEIEKTGLTTQDALRVIGDALGVKAGSFGVAGMKDKHARTRQWVSVPWPIKRAAPELAIERDDLRILRVDRHGNKIKRGHARENRFIITIREVPDGGVERAAAVFDELRRIGAPNRFGPQRFGRDGDNADQARAFIRGEARAPKNRRIRGLLISALQSEVFNRVLDLRIARGLYATAVVGDVMKKHDTGGLFDVDDVAVEQPRADRLEISPTAALPGPKARAASGDAQAIEDEALAQAGLTAEDVSKLDVGTRRALRFPLDEGDGVTALDDASYRVQLTLPSGAYATVVLAELIKPDGGEVHRTFANRD